MLHGRPSRREMSPFFGKKFGPFGATSGESLAEFFCYRIPIKITKLGRQNEDISNDANKD